jgi:hypothetical protein
MTKTAAAILQRPYLFLLCFLGSSFLLMPLATRSLGAGLVFDLLFYAIILAGLRAMGKTLLAKILVALIPVFIAGDVAGYLHGASWILGGICLLGMLMLLLICSSIIRSIHRAEKVSADTVMGGICVFLLLGMAFHLTYTSLAILEPGSFDFTVHGQREQLPDLSSLLFYYSFTCLLTTGFGDIVPMTSWAQSASVMEGVAGQLYLVVFIARLVGLQGSREASED